MPSSVRSAVWKLLRHCDERAFFLMDLWSCSTTLFKYFTRRGLRSFGTIFSTREVVNASIGDRSDTLNQMDWPT